SAVLDPGAIELGDRLSRIANAIDSRPQAEPHHRLDEELAELLRPLAVAPVPDPHEIAHFLDPAVRAEHARIRRFMPGPCALRPSSREPEVAEHASIGEHAIEVLELPRRKLIGRAHGAVVRVVEEELVTAPSPTMLADPPYELAVGPLMDDHEIRARERLVEVGAVLGIELARKPWIRAPEAFDRRRAVGLDEILAAPSMLRLEDRDV